MLAAAEARMSVENGLISKNWIQMFLWLALAALTVAVAAALLAPFNRRPAAVSRHTTSAPLVYRDQLSEVDRDLACGLIGALEADYAKAEIARRLIRASKSGNGAAAILRASPKWLKWSIVAFLLVVSISLYLSLGRPDLPSQPLAARLENPGNDMAVLIVKAERHLAANPEDGKGWDVLAPIYYNALRIADAEKAYRNAIRLLGPTPIRLDGLAETLMAGANGVVTEETRKVLEQSLTLEPDNPRAKFYVALSLEQARQTAEAKAAFEALAKESPADAPWLPLVNEHIAKNGGAPVAAGKAPGNPTEEDVAAAQDMSPGEQQQMIRGMVESLDAKLASDPNNFEGWMRLVRSYAVLNDKDRAASALKRGLAAFPADGEEGKQLIALGRELGIAAEAETE
jgi:cytochrome c-type biogenesis protein CcmH